MAKSRASEVSVGPDAGKRRQAAYLSAVTVWLTASASEMHLAPSAPMPLKVKLQKGVERRRQRAMTAGNACAVAYSSLISVLLMARAAERCLAASASRLLEPRLRSRDK